MKKHQNQDTMKEMIEILKGDYNFPAKLWIWGKVAQQWAGFIVWGAILLFVFVYLVFSISGSDSKVQNVKDTQQSVVLPMKDIVKFMAICQRSINERQEILKSLTEVINLYADQKLDQKYADRKLSTLSSLLKTCNTVRAMTLNEFARSTNPFEAPEISSAFDELIEDNKDFFKKNNKVLDPQEENEQWELLCALCQSEVKKANQELVQILNPEANTQKANFFNNSKE